MQKGRCAGGQYVLFVVVVPTEESVQQTQSVMCVLKQVNKELFSESCE